MKFFLDENFPKAGANLLTSRGHDVIDIRGTPDEGADDRYVFEKTQAEQAVFLTTDRDFYHTIPHLNPRHYGIVVIALKQPDRNAILKRLTWFIDHFAAKDIRGRAYLLRDDNFRVYPPQD